MEDIGQIRGDIGVDNVQMTRKVQFGLPFSGGWGGEGLLYMVNVVEVEEAELGWRRRERWGGVGEGG